MEKTGDFCYCAKCGQVITPQECTAFDLCVDCRSESKPAYIGLRHGAKRQGGRNVEVETTPEDSHDIIIRLNEAMVFLRTLDWNDKAALECAMNIAYCRGWLRAHFRIEREKREEKK